MDVVGLDSSVAAITAGYAHTCALTTAGAIKRRGFNYAGRIGDGTGGGGCVQDYTGRCSGAGQRRRRHHGGLSTYLCATTAGTALVARETTFLASLATARRTPIM